MKILFNINKNIIGWIFFICISITFLIVFIFTFKFDKRFEFYMYESENNICLSVNKTVYDYLGQKENNTIISYNDINYNIRYNFVTKVDNNYIYLTDFNNKISNLNIGYILLNNLNIFELF